MHLSLLLQMAADGFGDRIGLTTPRGSVTYKQLLEQAQRGATLVHRTRAGHLALLASNGAVVPASLFTAAWAGVPYAPLNYRLGVEQLDAMLAPLQPALIVRGEEWLDEIGAESPETQPAFDPDAAAVLLYTSGTTSGPKAAILRHRHLASYVIGSVEFGAADADEATLLAVPPYHVAGVAGILSNLYAGRRIVPLTDFSATGWLSLAEAENVTHATVVPTMLARLVEAMDAPPPALRQVAYGGALMPRPVLERALDLMPKVDFVNAYGLTETSSSIAVLTPEDHRDRHKLGSAGKLLPGVEIDVRDGEIWVRGEQVSGEYLGRQSPVDSEGWFPTRDRGSVDGDGYLWIDGRADDIIIRGGENIDPADIEEVLIRHPAVADAAVVGIPDPEWGERLAAVVVRRVGFDADADEVREWVRTHLRTSRTPDLVAFRDELPYTTTGKLVRREVRASLVD